MTEAQIKHMVDRFLQWRFPDSFSPDGGVSFSPSFKEEPMRSRHWPVGTNVLDANQAEAMIRHMLEGLPDQASPDVSNRMEVDVGTMAPSLAVFVMPHGALGSEARMKLSMFSAAVPALLNSGLQFDVFYNLDSNAIEVTAK